MPIEGVGTLGGVWDNIYHMFFSSLDIKLIIIIMTFYCLSLYH